jgi:3-oxoacyl-[acyl-carrier protein] reductase
MMSVQIMALTQFQSGSHPVMRLEGKVAAVTGGGAGIGEAICHRFAAEGARVVVLDLSLDGARRTADAIEDAVALEVDVSASAAVEAAIERIEREVGPLEILVNNAGAVALDHVKRVTPLLERQREESASGPPRTPLEALVRLTDEEWRFVLSVHLDGTFFCTRAAARRMAPRGTGAIINMASVCGIEGCTGHPHYSAAKAAILGFTRSIAKELIVQDIRVNAVAPGFIDTQRLKGTLGRGRQGELARTPAGRLGTPEEVAAAVAFLASEDGGYFVGATLSPNGGLLTAV